MKKYLFNSSWLSLLGLYFLIYILTFTCAMVAADEYTRGDDRIIDIGSDIYLWIFLSPASFFESMKLNVHTDAVFILFLFLFNTAINAMFWVTLLNYIYLRFMRKR